MNKISQIIKRFDKALIRDVMGTNVQKKAIKKDAIFSNAIARYNESKLLKKEQLLRLISAADYTESIRMLYDYGYVRAGDFDIDAFIDAQLNALNEYAVSECYSVHMQKVILNPYIYNNAKVYYKQMRMSAEQNADALYAINDEPIRQAIEGEKYDSLDFFMRRCLVRLDEQGEKTGKDVDTAFTNAMLADSLLHAGASLKRELISLVRAQIDVNNFVTFIRCRRLKREWDFCLPMLVKGGKISVDTFKNFYDAEESKVAEQFSFKGYEFLQRAYEGKMNLDLSLDAEIIKASLINCMNYTSMSPFLSYYYRQLTEFKVVRMVLTLLKNGLRDEIERRVRGLYD